MSDHTDCYDKPVWTLAALAGAMPGIPGHLARVLPSFLSQGISNALRERLMLAVAAQNRCTYCQVAHSALGRLSGLASEEIACILHEDDGELPAAERAAVVFVRDLARREFIDRDEALHARMAEHFSLEQCQMIEASAHVMNFANRFGNSYDALRARLAGRCETTGASWADLLVVSSIFAGATAMSGPLVGWLGLRPPARG